MTECEVRIAEQARRYGRELIVARRPAAQAPAHPDAIGLVKTHHVRYLPERAEPCGRRLAAGERTPVFRIDAQPLSRHSWYLRLPGPPGGPWAGIVRCEAARHARRRGRRLADTVTVTLPRFASVPHKDPRAPQNLAPIGGLERILRHRLGDAAGVLSRLRVRRVGTPWFRPLDRSGRLARTPIERPAVIDQAIPPSVSPDRRRRLESPRRRSKACASGPARRRAAPKRRSHPTPKKRSKLPLLLVLLGLGALVFFVPEAPQRASPHGHRAHAFGAAVEPSRRQQRRATPLTTPGG